MRSAEIALLGILAFGGMSSSALAQFEIFRVLTCADFQKYPDGSWSPTRPVHIGKWLITPGVYVRPGDFIGGYDLGSALERSCTGHGLFLDWH
jgi:hypothetical protein